MRQSEGCRNMKMYSFPDGLYPRSDRKRRVLEAENGNRSYVYAMNEVKFKFIHGARQTDIPKRPMVSSGEFRVCSQQLGAPNAANLQTPRTLSKDMVFSVQDIDIPQQTFGVETPKSHGSA